MVRDKVKQVTNIEVSSQLVREVMKREMKLSYVQAKKLNPSANSVMSLVLRQQYALKMMELLEQGKRVINIDETWLN